MSDEESVDPVESFLTQQFQMETGLNAFAECDVWTFYSTSYVLWLEEKAKKSIDG
jgi:hypothetical protein